MKLARAQRPLLLNSKSSRTFFPVIAVLFMLSIKLKYFLFFVILLVIVKI